MVILGRCLGAKAQVQGGAISGFDIWPGDLPALPHFGIQARRVCVELHTLSEAKRGAFAKKFRIAHPFKAFGAFFAKEVFVFLQKSKLHTLHYGTSWSRVFAIPEIVFT